MGPPLADRNADVISLNSGTVLRVLQDRFQKTSGYAANKDRKNFLW